MPNQSALLLKAALKRSHSNVVLRSVPPMLPEQPQTARYDGLNLSEWDAFHQVVGWSCEDSLHPCVPHILAFSQHLKLMLDSEFPFALLGLVHLRNRITQHRPIQPQEAFELVSELGDCVRHPKGWLFSLNSRVMVRGECVWSAQSDNLFRVKHVSDKPLEAIVEAPSLLAGEGERWSLGSDLGRRYARVSGDYNLIHIHPLLARLLGFRQAIAHGMWSKARVLSSVLKTQNRAFDCAVSFRKPVFLPSTVKCVVDNRGNETLLQVQNGNADILHLDANIKWI